MLSFPQCTEALLLKGIVSDKRAINQDRTGNLLEELEEMKPNCTLFTDSNQNKSTARYYEWQRRWIKEKCRRFYCYPSFFYRKLIQIMFLSHPLSKPIMTCPKKNQLNQVKFFDIFVTPCRLIRNFSII